MNAPESQQMKGIKMDKRVPVVFSLGEANYKKLEKLALDKGMTAPEFVWDLVMEAIEDDEDIREVMQTWDEEEGRITLEECIQEFETRDRSQDTSGL